MFQAEVPDDFLHFDCYIALDDIRFDKLHRECSFRPEAAKPEETTTSTTESTTTITEPTTGMDQSGLA